MKIKNKSKKHNLISLKSKMEQKQNENNKERIIRIKMTLKQNILQCGILAVKLNNDNKTTKKSIN